MSQASQDARSRRSTTLVSGLTMAAVALFWLFVWRNDLQLRQERSELALGEAEKVVLAFEDHAVRLFEFGDSLLRAMREYYLEHGAGADLQTYLTRIRGPQADDLTAVLTIAAADGTVLFHSPSADAAPTVNLRQTDYFQALSEHPQDALFIGPTRLGRISQELYYRLALPILRDGRFDGVILLSMRPEHLAAFYQGFKMGPHSSLTVLTLDHRMIARQPLPPPEILTQPLDITPLWQALTQAPTGSYTKTATIDGEQRIYWYKKFNHYPIVVTLGISQADLRQSMASSRLNSPLLAGLFTLTALAFCLLLLGMQRKAQHLIATEAESRRTAELLRTQAEALRRSNSDLERFAYVASHDLQEPLRTIVAFVQLLERKHLGALDEEGKSYLAFVTDGARRMSLLIKDLLAFSRVSMTAETLTPVDSAACLEQAQANLAAAIDSSGARIQIGRLPAILGDAPQITSLWQNLLSNAIKYRAAGRPPLIAITAERRDDDLWQFSVADNGIGIAAQYYARIFVIFQRLHHRSQYEGTGVGLALCQRIVQRMGGEIWVESVPDQGSVFHFTAQPAGGAETPPVIATPPA